MEIIREDIVAGLRAIGLPQGATVLVHSSLSSFGYVVDGANAVVEALIRAVGPQGNVLVPTLTGSEALNPSNPPFFDVRNTPCWTGRIPETFRQRPDSLRSLHPTHSVAAIGPDKADLLRDHELSPTPCGLGSPYHRLVSAENGYIVFLGIGLQCNTTFHHLEEMSEAPYHMQSEPALATIVDYLGRSRQLPVRLHQYGTRRNFARPEPYFLAKGIERMGRIGNCTVRLLQAKPMAEYVLERLRADPEYLVARDTPHLGPSHSRV
ncbi:MAG: AAC(3) family N-acetyltransferase [Anaerolineae bacterium]